MSIRREEAAEALKTATAAAGRSVAAAGYARTAPYLFVWGGVWVLANLAGLVGGLHRGLVWLALSTLGVVASVIISLRIRGPGGGGRRESVVRALLLALAIALFAMAMPIVLPGLTYMQVESLICLAVGAAYVVMGTFTGLRLSAVGMLVMLGAIAAHVWGGPIFFLWMALVGGGGLILGGLWLRRA